MTVLHKQVSICNSSLHTPHEVCNFCNQSNPVLGVDYWEIMADFVNEHEAEFTDHDFVAVLQRSPDQHADGSRRCRSDFLRQPQRTDR